MSTSSQTTFKCTIIAFLLIETALVHLSDSLNPTSEECTTLMDLVNKTKQQSFHISVQKKKKKAALHWLDFPLRGNKHSYNLLRSTAIDRSRPCADQPCPRAMGTQLPGKSPCSPKSTSCMFYREKQKRYSFTGKFTIQSLESVRATRRLG